MDRATNGKRAEAAAQRQRAHEETALLLDRVRDGYVLMDAELQILAVNASAERLFGRPRQDLLGSMPSDASAFLVEAQVESQLLRVAADRVERRFVQHYVGGGRDLHLEVDVYPSGEGGVALFWRDISERVRALEAAEGARADAEARARTLAAVIDGIPDAIVVQQPDGVALANQAALEQLGAPSIEALRALTGHAPAPLESLLLDPATGAVVPLAITPVGRAFSGERSHAHFLLRTLDAAAAETRSVRLAAGPIVGPDGTISGAVAILTDTSRLHAVATERERLLAELSGERTLLRTVLDQMPAAVFIVEAPSGRVLAMNAEVARVWGEPRPFTDAVGRYSEEWVGFHGDGRRLASDEWPVARAALAEEVISGWTGEIERPDGTRVTIEVSAAPVHDAEGRTVAAVAVAADITARTHALRERERLLRELELERARLAYVFQHAPAFLAILRGPTYVFELANEAYYRLMGQRDLIGRPVWEALPEVRGPGFEDRLHHVVATGEPFLGREVPITVARTPGAEPEVRFVDLTFMPLVEADGTRSGVIAHGSDVTEQVLARREIERLLADSERARRDAEVARSEAEAANRIKGEFLAVMSHELRTPLNAIGGYAELMELGIRGPVSPQQREDLARIQKSQRHLLGLINGVLNYSRAEAGAVHYELRDTPLDVVLATCETLIAPQARAKGISLQLSECDDSLVARIDAEKVQQVIVNLLSNAVKFTSPGGSIVLACRRDDVRGDERSVIVTVTDTGRGIAHDAIERIFEPFVQVDSRLTRTDEGIGLGLAISRDLARGMGGDLTADSTPGLGSTFTLRLPAA
jgi:PAS domain S-box-containing protein